MVRFADRAIRDRAKWIRDGGEKRSEDDIGARTPLVGKDETKQKKRYLWTKLVRAYTRKASSREMIRSLWEMTELPEDLQEAAREAKREIREAEQSGKTRTGARKLAKRAPKTRLVPVQRSPIFLEIGQSYLRAFPFSLCCTTSVFPLCLRLVRLLRRNFFHYILIDDMERRSHRQYIDVG